MHTTLDLGKAVHQHPHSSVGHDAGPHTGQIITVSAYSLFC